MNLDYFENIITGNNYYGVEVCFTDKGQTYFITEVKKDKSGLTIGQTFTVSNLEAAKQKIPNKVPVIITFTGQGVINKLESDDGNYQSKIIFNSNPNDFYWSKYKVGDSLFVSVSRKTKIEAELEKWQEAGYFVVKSYIGSFVSNNVQKILSEPCVETSQETLCFEEGKLISFSANDTLEEKRYIIGDQELSSFYIIGFSAVLDYLYPNEWLENTLDYFAHHKKEFFYKNLFNKLGKVFVVFLFISLLGSYLLLDRYQQKLLDLSLELNAKEAAYNDVIRLKQDKSNKEEILNSSGIYSSHFLSYYASQLTSVMPADILLESMSIFPENKKDAKDGAILFKSNQIIISGQVKVNKLLSVWVKEIKKMDWVKVVEIVDFDRWNSKNKFVIKIYLETDV